MNTAAARGTGSSGSRTGPGPRPRVGLGRPWQFGGARALSLGERAASTSAASCALDVGVLRPPRELGGVQLGIPGSGHDQRWIVEQAPGHGPNPQCPEQALSLSRSVVVGGDEGTARRFGGEGTRIGLGGDRHPVAPLQAGGALGEPVRLAGLEREHDHPRIPLQAGAVVPAQALADRLGREGKRARRIGEQGDLEGHRRVALGESEPRT
jgi:hypothetical protein